MIRRFIYHVLSGVDYILCQKPVTVAIYCFHSIASDSWRFSIDRDMFIQQIEYLLKDRKSITMIDIYNHIVGNKIITEPSFAICFDDGYKDILSVSNFLKNKNVKPTLFVLSHTEDANIKELGTTRLFLNNSEIKDLQKDGWTIGSHSATHQDFSFLSRSEILKEVVESKKDLERFLEVPIEYFAYPRGRYTKEIINTLHESGYHMALSMDDGEINQRTNLYIVPRIGVDRSHSLSEFKILALPSVISFRKIAKSVLGVWKIFSNNS